MKILSQGIKAEKIMAEEDTLHDALASECLLTSALIHKLTYMQHRYIPHTTQHIHAYNNNNNNKMYLRENIASSTYRAGTTWCAMWKKKTRSLLFITYQNQVKIDQKL